MKYIIFIAVFSVFTYLFGDCAGFRRTYRPYGEQLESHKPNGWPLSRIKNKELFNKYHYLIKTLALINLAWILHLNLKKQLDSMYLYLNLIWILMFIVGATFGCLRCKLKVKGNCKLFGLSFPDMKPLGNT